MDGVSDEQGQNRNANRFLEEKPEGERLLANLMQMKGYIKMDLKENGKERAGWINLAQDGNKWRPLVNTIMRLQVTCNVDNCSTGSRNISFLKQTLFHGVS